jgi:hypothetical protein
MLSKRRSGGSKSESCIETSRLLLDNPLGEQRSPLDSAAQNNPHRPNHPVLLRESDTRRGLHPWVQVSSRVRRVKAEVLVGASLSSGGGRVPLTAVAPSATSITESFSPAFRQTADVASFLPGITQLGVNITGGGGNGGGGGGASALPHGDMAGRRVEWFNETMVQPFGVESVNAQLAAKEKEIAYMHEMYDKLVDEVEHLRVATDRDAVVDACATQLEAIKALRSETNAQRQRREKAEKTLAQARREHQDTAATLRSRHARDARRAEQSQADMQQDLASMLVAKKRHIATEAALRNELAVARRETESKEEQLARIRAEIIAVKTERAEVLSRMEQLNAVHDENTKDLQHEVMQLHALVETSEQKVKEAKLEAHDEASTLRKMNQKYLDQFRKAEVALNSLQTKYMHIESKYQESFGITERLQKDDEAQKRSLREMEAALESMTLQHGMAADKVAFQAAEIADAKIKQRKATDELQDLRTADRLRLEKNANAMDDIQTKLSSSDAITLVQEGTLNKAMALTNSSNKEEARRASSLLTEFVKAHDKDDKHLNDENTNMRSAITAIKSITAWNSKMNKKVVDRKISNVASQLVTEAQKRLSALQPNIGCRYVTVDVKKTSSGKKGVRLVEIIDDRPAQIAGLIVDDIITHVDDVVTETKEKFRSQVCKHRPGDFVTFQCHRLMSNTGAWTVQDITVAIGTDSLNMDELETLHRVSAGVVYYTDLDPVSSAMAKRRMIAQGLLKKDDDPTLDVFLGGSCNPTTWRHDITMPMLERFGVSFYNPQVDEWTPDLVDIEMKAKDTSTILLFVIDNSTRALASMLEASGYIGEGRKVVLVIQLVDHGATINGVHCSTDEVKDLNRAREYLKGIARQHGIPMFTDPARSIAQATRNCIDQIKGQVLLSTKDRKGSIAPS